MDKSIDWWTVIIGTTISIITVHAIINKFIDKVLENEKKFLDEIKNIVIKTINDKSGK